jgi:SnoaL-like domain
VGSQSGPRVVMGRPVVEGDRVAVEWWATYRNAEGEEITLPGILMLRFEDDGRCAELREAWNWETGRREPYPGWGA